MATFSTRYRPVSYYSREAKKTFFVYGGTTSSAERHLLIMISYFDHRTKTVPRPVIVCDKMGVNEPYDNASLTVDKNGYLWVFVSGWARTRPGIVYRSLSPYSIEGFEKIGNYEMISPQSWAMDDNSIQVMFSRAGNETSLYSAIMSADNKWNEPVKLAAFGGHNMISEARGSKLVAVFNYFPEMLLDKQTNLYLLQTEDRGKTWKNINNVPVELPLTSKNNSAMIADFESEGKLVFLIDLNFDKEGNPVLLVIKSTGANPGPEGDPREWTIIFRRNDKWNYVKVCTSTNNYDKGSLYIESEKWKIIGPTEPGPQKYGTGGEIALWESYDEGFTWEKTTQITNNSVNNNSFVRKPRNARKDLYAFWTDGNADAFSPSYLYFTNIKGDKVWLLPYEMTEEQVKPRRIK
jgi:hypothetical protein